jgi:hypothetical protein
MDFFNVRSGFNAAAVAGADTAAEQICHHTMYETSSAGARKTLQNGG